MSLDARGTGQLPLNTWTHLAATYDGATLRLYVNGAEVGNRVITGALLTSTGVLRIGGNSIWGEFFQGRIDEVRIYNRPLTHAEILTDMTASVDGSLPDTTPPVRFNGQPAGVLAWGTTQTTLSLTTDEYATCRYSTQAGVAYSAMLQHVHDDGFYDPYDSDERADQWQQLHRLRPLRGRAEQREHGRLRHCVLRSEFVGDNEQLLWRREPAL